MVVRVRNSIWDYSNVQNVRLYIYLRLLEKGFNTAPIGTVHFTVADST